MNRTLRYGLVFFAMFFVLLYVGVALARIGYPFQLEWMEGGTLAHVKRILDGESIYVPPSLDFVAYLYPPLYFYASSILARVIGVGFLPLRCLSFLSSLGCFVCIFWTVRRETKESYAALLSTGLFAACFRVGGAWFDLARVDSLFLFLLLAGIGAIRCSPSRRSALAAGILISLSFLVKQTALLVCVPIAIHNLVFRRKGSLAFFVTVVVIIGGTTLFYEWRSQGWYFFYLFSMPSQHPILGEAFLSFWTRDMLFRFPIALLLAAWGIGVGMRRGEMESSWFYLLTGGGMIVGSWLSRLHSGGYANVLLPAYAFLSLRFGMGAHRTEHRGRGMPLGERQGLRI